MRQAEVVGFSIRIKVNSGLECACGPVCVSRVLVALSQTRVPKGPAPRLVGRQRHCQLELAPGHFGNSRTCHPARSLRVQSEVFRRQQFDLALCLSCSSRVVLTHSTTKKVSPGSWLAWRNRNVLLK